MILRWKQVKGNLLFTEKKFDEAIDAYSRAISLKGNYAQAYYNRGLAEYYSGKKEAACLDLKQAVKLGNNSAESAFNQLCKKKGRGQRAEGREFF